MMLLFHESEKHNYIVRTACAKLNGDRKVVKIVKWLRECGEFFSSNGHAVCICTYNCICNYLRFCSNLSIFQSEVGAYFVYADYSARLREH